jgi:hypothetical protein
VCLVLLVAGCSGNIDRNVEILGDANENYPIAAADNPRTIRLECKSNPEPVSVYVVKTEDQDKVVTIIRDHPELVIDKREVQQEPSFDATIPPKTSCMVVVRNTSRRPTNVHVKIAFLSK